MPAGSNDPIKSANRKAKAQRRAGVDAVCTQCGQSDPNALVKRSRPKLCYECYQEKRGKKRTEPHHIGGKNNSRMTVRIRSNDHRRLSDEQNEWPPRTLQNSDGSPLLALAGALRGTAAFIEDIITRMLRTCAEFAERLDAWLREQHGGNWWTGTPFDGWRPG
jgi:nicotinamidase-related amidase